MSFSEHFSLANIPYGIASDANHAKGVVTRVGDSVVFLSDLNLTNLADLKSALSQVWPFVPTHLRILTASKPTLNALAAVGKTELGIFRKNIQQTLCDESTLSKHGVPIAEVQLHLPIKVDGFTDFSCSKEHLLNASEAVVGKASMPPAAPYFPIGYSGRPSSIVLSGTNITRPYGQYRDGNSIGFGPSRALDYELEVACIIGKPTQLGDRVAVTDADEHIFGLVLLNDWSARDIQGFEMSPLGPMNGKSFGTSISPWGKSDVTLSRD
ncbi:hypothetical protein CaCOL14_003879 [Colletotrichum acutatum]